MDLTGIINENEFFTHHYLSAILENDLKNLFSTWTQQEKTGGIKTPYAQLASLRADYFKLAAQLEREKDLSEQLHRQQDFFGKLFFILGYRLAKANEKEMESGETVPVIGEVKERRWHAGTMDTANDDQRH